MSGAAYVDTSCLVAIAFGEPGGEEPAIEDAWHLASALYLAEDPADLPFFALDARQAELAGALGFPAAG